MFSFITVASSADNTKRTVISFLCPFLYISCHVIYIINTSFFTTSCFPNGLCGILTIPIVSPIGRIFCYLPISFFLGLDKPLQYRIIFCTKSQMTCYSILFFKSFRNTFSLFKLNVCPRLFPFSGLWFSSLLIL